MVVADLPASDERLTEIEARQAELAEKERAGLLFLRKRCRYSARPRFEPVQLLPSWRGHGVRKGVAGAEPASGQGRCKSERP